MGQTLLAERASARASQVERGVSVPIAKTHYAYAFAKRTLDLAASASVLILVVPLLVLLAILVRLDSPGPIVFRQRRVGRAPGVTGEITR